MCLSPMCVSIDLLGGFLEFFWLPPMSSNFSRSSIHCSRNVSCTLYSYSAMNLLKLKRKQKYDISVINSIIFHENFNIFKLVTVGMHCMRIIHSTEMSAFFSFFKEVKPVFIFGIDSVTTLSWFKPQLSVIHFTFISWIYFLTTSFRF